MKKLKNKVRTFFRKTKEEKAVKRGKLGYEFPSISRIITETISATFHTTTRKISLRIFYIFMVIAILFSGVDFYRTILKQQQTTSQREKVLSEVSYWRQVVAKYNDYRDGYFMLALLEYRLGNMNKVGEYLEKVRALDPNFVKAKELEKVIGVSRE